MECKNQPSLAEALAFISLFFGMSAVTNIFINCLQNTAFLQNVAEKWWFSHVANFHGYVSPLH